MSPETRSTGDKPNPSAGDEGRREPAGQQPAPVQRSGGVRVDSTSVSQARVSWESLGDRETNADEQAVSDGEASVVAQAVGVLHSSVDLHYFKRCKEPREDTCSTRRSEGKDVEMAGTEHRTRTPQKVRHLQLTLYRKAKAEPKYRFWSLYGELLRRDVLETALAAQLRNGGEAGVDGEELAAINATPATRQRWLDRLQEDLRAKRYRPRPVRRVLIPKSSGGHRALGIPTVRDRVVQTAVYLLLMPIWEADFHPRSYGFRPKRRAHDALNAIRQAIWRGKVEIIDADLSKYFDTIPHGPLMRLISKRVSDGSILKLIRQWLSAPVVETDRQGTRRIIPNRCGTPQGGVISPLLANLYLNSLDWSVNERCAGQPELHRYADDFVMTCWPGQGRHLLPRLHAYLKAKGLKLNEEKTRLVNLRRESLNFLGFTFRWQLSRAGKPYVHVEPSAKSRQALRRKLRELLNHWTRGRPTREVITEMNRLLRGWAGYFHAHNASVVMRRMNRYSRERLRAWLWRKHGEGRSKWATYTDQKLHTVYGLYEMPQWAPWYAARAAAEK